MSGRSDYSGYRDVSDCEHDLFTVISTVLAGSYAFQTFKDLDEIIGIVIS